jgi:hypothetical protein
MDKYSSIPSEVKNKLLDLVKTGDEKRVRDFVIEHIKEFPEDVRDSLIFGFFSEAVQDSGENAEALMKFKEEGLSALMDLARAKEDLKKIARS